MKVLQKPKSLLLFLILLGSLPSFSNQSKVDSCVTALQSYPHSQFEKPYANLLFKTGEAYFKVEKYETSTDYFFQSLTVAKSAGCDSLNFHSLLNLGHSYFWQSEYDSSLVYYHKAMDFGGVSYSLTMKDTSSLFNGFGNTYYYMGQVNKAYHYRMKLLELNKGRGDIQGQANSFYALAELDKEQKQYEKAKEKISLALELYQSLDRQEDVGYCYDMLSTISFELKDYNQSLDYQNLACSSKFGLKSQYHKGYCAHGYGLIYLKLNKLELALDYLNTALAIRKASNQKEETIQTQIALAELKMLMGKCVQAKKILNQCLENPILNKVTPVRQNVYKKISEVNFNCGNNKVAYDFQKKYYELRDSVEEAITKNELANLSSIFELDQKKKELELLKKDKALNKLYYIFICIVFCILIGIVGVVSWFFKKQYYYNLKLKDHKIQIEKQNKALHNSNEKLKVANVELENFAYIASHDLKAPLRTVMSYTGLIEKRYAKVLDENGLEFLRLVTEGVSHMHQLLDDVLSYSNVEKGKDNFNPVDLNELMTKILQTLEVNIQEQNAIIRYEKLPIVLGNQIQLFQVLQNLIANAIKFIPEGVQPMIKITVSEKNGKPCIAIKDNGIGIEKKYHDRIFSLFKRLHSSQEYQGTGLGLSICKKIVQRHGGEIWVESDGTSGTTFYFTLQFAEVEAPMEIV
ncbi:MAG: ATP-binding protein [Saprospiraceae bacterium]